MSVQIPIDPTSTYELSPMALKSSPPSSLRPPSSSLFPSSTSSRHALSPRSSLRLIRADVGVEMEGEGEEEDVGEEDSGIGCSDGQSVRTTPTTLPTTPTSFEDVADQDDDDDVTSTLLLTSPKDRQQQLHAPRQRQGNSSTTMSDDDDADIDLAIGDDDDDDDVNDADDDDDDEGRMELKRLDETPSERSPTPERTTSPEVDNSIDDDEEPWSPPAPKLNPTLRLSVLIKLAEASERQQQKEQELREQQIKQQQRLQQQQQQRQKLRWKRPRRVSEGDAKRKQNDEDADFEDGNNNSGIKRQQPHRNSLPRVLSQSRLFPRSPPPLKTFDFLSTLSSGSLASRRSASPRLGLGGGSTGNGHRPREDSSASQLAPQQRNLRHVCCDGVNEKLLKNSLPAEPPLKSSLKRRPSTLSSTGDGEVGGGGDGLTPSLTLEESTPLLTSLPTPEKTVTFNPLTTSVVAPSPLPSPDEEEAGEWPCQKAAADAAGMTEASTGVSTALPADAAAASSVKKTVIVKLDPNTMRATTDGSGRVTMTIIDPKRINHNSGSGGGSSGGNSDENAVQSNNANIVNNDNSVPAVAVLNAKSSSTSSSPPSPSGHSVRYSGVTRVMVYSPEQCSAHVGHVCSKHKTVTIPLDSIEAMRRAEIMWPIMRYCYAVLTAAVCLGLAGLLLFFLFPRLVEIKASKERIFPHFRHVTTSNKTDWKVEKNVVALKYYVDFRVINNNYIPITIEEINSKVQVFETAQDNYRNNSQIEVPLRSGVNLTSNVGISLTHNLGFMQVYCDDRKEKTHSLDLKLDVTIRYRTMLGREGRIVESWKQKVSCGPDGVEEPGGKQVGEAEWKRWIEGQGLAEEAKRKGESNDEGNVKPQSELEFIGDVEVGPMEGRHKSPDGRPASPDGRPASPDGRPASPQGRPATAEGRPASLPEGGRVSEGSPATSEGRLLSMEGRPLLPEGRLPERSGPNDRSNETESSIIDHRRANDPTYSRASTATNGDSSTTSGDSIATDGDSIATDESASAEKGPKETESEMRPDSNLRPTNADSSRRNARIGRRNTRRGRRNTRRGRRDSEWSKAGG